MSKGRQENNEPELSGVWHDKVVKLNGDLARRDLDEIIEMSSKEMGEIDNISDITFREYYQSRIIGLAASNRGLRYYYNRTLLSLRKPFTYLRFRGYQLLGA